MEPYEGVRKAGVEPYANVLLHRNKVASRDETSRKQGRDAAWNRTGAYGPWNRTVAYGGGQRAGEKACVSFSFLILVPRK